MEMWQHLAVMVVVALCAAGAVRMVVRELRGECVACVRSERETEKTVGLTVRGLKR
jgi:hypothetical protein